MLSISTTTVNLTPSAPPGLTPMAFAPVAESRLAGPVADPMLTGFMQGQELAFQGLMTQLVQLLAGLVMGGRPGASAGCPNCSGSNSSGTASSGTAGGTGSGASSSSADPSQFKGGTDTGRRLAAAAQAEATNGDSNGGLCFRDAGRALRTVGINTSGASAYMAADQLAKNPKVREIKVPQDQLKSLPPGAIVVWDRGPGHPHGHISIALGDGREASDLIRNQITNYGTSFRVFMPV